MVKHIWSLLCRRSIVDKDSNNVSIFDIFEQLTVETKINDNTDETKSKKINLPIDYELVSFWVKDRQQTNLHFKGQVKIEVMNPKGVSEKSFEQLLDIPKDMKRLRTRIMIRGLVVEESGIYIFSVSFKDDENQKYNKVAEVPLEIIIKNR